jgi:hypothetical protein
MPNWFKNQIALKGEPARLAAFKQAHIKTVEFRDEPGEYNTFLDFETVIPMPMILKDTTSTMPETRTEKEVAAHEATGYYNWYDWSCENWGVKWNSQCGGVNPDSPDDILEFSFQTAWAPPLPVIRKLLQMWPDLTLIEYKGYDEGDWYEIEYDLLTGVATADDEVRKNYADGGPRTCTRLTVEGMH